MDKKLWTQDAAAKLATIIPTLDLVTGEDLRFALNDAGFPAPNHPNTWGALTAHMKKKGMLVETGEHRPMTASKSNGRQTPIYFFQTPVTGG